MSIEFHPKTPFKTIKLTYILIPIQFQNYCQFGKKLNSTYETYFKISFEPLNITLYIKTPIFT